MGSQIILSEVEQVPFRLALESLRGELNSSPSFYYMVSRGLTTINLIVGLVLRRDHPEVFSDFVYQRWMKEERRECFYGAFKKPDETRTEDVRKRYELLRTALNRPSTFAALAEIGPCVFTIWNPEDSSTADDISIMIHNWVGRETMPNCDYELSSDGEVRFTG